MRSVMVVNFLEENSHSSRSLIDKTTLRQLLFPKIQHGV